MGRLWTGALGLTAFAAAAGLAATALGLLALDRTLRVATLPAWVEPPAAIEVVALWTGALVSLWFAGHAAVGATCTTAMAFGRQWRVGERLVARYAPAVVRRILAGSLGATLGLAALAGPVSAAETDGYDLGWWPTPGGAEVPDASTPASAPSPTTGPLPSSAPPFHVVPTSATSAELSAAADFSRRPSVTVEPGDSLWAIAATHLPPDAGPAEIAATWPDWYEANRATIGDDPDLIHPGQVLLVPDRSTGVATGGQP